MEGVNPDTQLNSCGSDLQGEIAAMRVFPATSVVIYSGGSQNGKAARLLSGTYAFDPTAQGMAKTFEFQRDDVQGKFGPGSIRVYAQSTSSQPPDFDFSVSAGWVMMSQFSKDNTGPEWPILNYGFESTEEKASEEGSEKGTESGTESSFEYTFASSVEKAASMSVTNEHSAGGSITVGAEASGSIPLIADVSVSTEWSANYQYTNSKTSEYGYTQGTDRSATSSHSSSDVSTDVRTSVLAKSAGVSKNKGMECALQCQVPSTLHPATGKDGQQSGSGRAPGNEVNDGIGFTCPKPTKIADPNVYVWFWQVKLLRPDDPTSKTTVDMCLTQCTCTPTPPACPYGKCADEFCTTCKPPIGCPVMRATGDGNYMELNNACLKGITVDGGKGGKGPGGSLAVSQYRKGDDIWDHLWTGFIDLDTTGGWGHSSAQWATQAASVTMPGKRVGGDTVARQHTPQTSAHTSFEAGDHLVFLNIKLANQAGDQ
jgi:hypothetical protein